jgi:hypothetical protein
VHVTAYKSIFAAVLLALVLFAGAGLLRAQDEPQAPTEDKPKPAGTSYPIPAIDSTDQQDQNGAPNNTLQPDTTPLTGIQDATLGSPEIRHSYWVPGIQWAGTIQSNSYNQSQNSSWLMNNYLIGNLSLLKAWSRSELAINYSGGGFFSTDSAQGNGVYQSLTLSQAFQWNRWSVQILDQFSYSPLSLFGFGGGTNLGVPGVGGALGSTVPGMGTSYLPSDSIYASIGPRYINATALQMTYATSPRGSITASGSYGLLHFVDPGNVDNNTTTATVGYNYALSREDSIGAFYRFSSYHYPGQPQAFGNQSFNIAFSRRRVGRLALQFYGGPAITTFRVPIGGQSNEIGANAGASVTYAVKDSELSGHYVHGLSGGSGVFTGSNLDQLTFSASHRLSRVWSGHFNFGFAHSTSVVNPAAASSTALTYPGYNSWFIGGGVGRPLGRNAALAIAYNATTYTYSQSGCTGSSCNGNQNSNNFTNYITINLQWHTRPFVLP